MSNFDWSNSFASGEEIDLSFEETFEENGHSHLLTNLNEKLTPIQEEEFEEEADEWDTLEDMTTTAID